MLLAHDNHHPPPDDDQFDWNYSTGRCKLMGELEDRKLTHDHWIEDHL